MTTASGACAVGSSGVLRDELGEKATLERLMPYLSEKYGAQVERGTIALHSNRDLGATIASGSHGCRGMVIVPCSMKTLAAVAHGLSRNLVERAARVSYGEGTRQVSDDRGLIRYLMRHRHSTPFEMAEIKLLATVGVNPECDSAKPPFKPSAIKR